MDQLPSRQEMFNRAWNGLKSQGFERAWEHGSCSYLTQDGRRCAWGWVDPEGTVDPYTGRQRTGGVWTLSGRGEEVIGYGLARLLTDPEDLAWAEALQSAHDGAQGSQDLQNRLRLFAAHNNLTVPE